MQPTSWHIHLNLFCLLLLALTSGGCRTTSPEPPATPTVELTEILIDTPQPGFPTLTPVTPSVTPVHTVAPERRSTATRRPTATLKPTGTATRTPLPTYSTSEAQALLDELYATNGGCQLPCWWGFQPGITKWEEAQQLLERLAIVPIHSSHLGDNTYHEVLIPTESKEMFSRPRWQNYWAHKGIIESIEINMTNIFPFADLVLTIHTYGKPSEIWVNTGTFVPPGVTTTHFIFVMFYEEQGLMFRFDDHKAKINDRVVIGCPTEMSGGLAMILWDPGKKRSFSEMSKKFHNFPKDLPHLPLEEATGVTVDEFYERYDQGEAACLQTPIELWSSVVIP